jgi:hypothetical protein
MSTSGTTDFSVTRDDIIKRALRLIGATSQGETPTATQISEAALSLNGLVKAWAADGMPLWAITEKTLTLISGQAVYTVSNPKPLKVLQAWNHNTTSNVDIPMRIITQAEYNVLGNKTSAGNPIQVYYDPRRDIGEMHLFPVPTTVEQSANAIKYVCQIPFEDFDASTDNPDFPQEWYDAITYGLATRLAPEYGVPIPDRKVLWQEMSVIKQEALNFGLEEGSLYFGVERRGW